MGVVHVMLTLLRVEKIHRLYTDHFVHRICVLYFPDGFQDNPTVKSKCSESLQYYLLLAMGPGLVNSNSSLGTNKGHQGTLLVTCKRSVSEATVELHLCS